MKEDRATEPAMEPNEALAILTTPAVTDGRCAVCALPVGWIAADALVEHARYHDAVAVLARVALGGAA